MTTAWGKVVPCQIDMINLAGFDVWLYPGEDPPLSEKGKKRMMIVGHARLTKRTGQDFGFETRRWHD